MKKIIILPIIVLIFFFSGTNSYADKESGITYTVIDGRATVTGFTGEPENLDIPPEIDGVPVVAIRDNAFYKCSSLIQISLPEGLEKMGHHCFFDCTSLEEIIIPDSVSEIGMGCFESCIQLREAVLPDNLILLQESCFRNCISLEKIIIPQRTAEIQQFCFAECTALSNVSLGGKLLKVGDLAFFGCPNIHEIYIPESVEAIGIQAFGYSSEGLINTFSITGKSNSEADKYAQINGFPFSGQPAAADAFAPQDSENAPVNLPEIFIFAGLFFFILAIISAFRSKRK